MPLPFPGYRDGNCTSLLARPQNLSCFLSVEEDIRIKTGTGARLLQADTRRVMMRAGDEGQFVGPLEPVSPAAYTKVRIALFAEEN